MAIPKSLSIAGSDSGGGAGIQADLKTFSAHRVYGASVITSVTAQNTLTVSAIQNISTKVIEKQIEAVMSDIKPHTVKTGMLSTSAIIDTVARSLKKYGVRKLVVDPVMISKSGAVLLERRAVKSLVDKLLPLALVVTPNIPEAEALSGVAIGDIRDMEEAARIIFRMGAKFVVVKGGHLKSSATDIAFDGRFFYYFESVRLKKKNTHGTGCTFSAAIAANLAYGKNPIEAIHAAKQYITNAIKYSYSIGKGHGPVNHFFKF